MFISNVDGSYIAYKNLINNSILVFNNAGEMVVNVEVKCTNWQPLNLFEVPVKVLESVVSNKQ